MNKIALFMLFGQSNATGHGVPMSDEDIIKEPLGNVWGLNREPNQSYDTEKLKFSRYTSFDKSSNSSRVIQLLAKLKKISRKNITTTIIKQLFIILFIIFFQNQLIIHIAPSSMSEDFYNLFIFVFFISIF